MIINNKPFRIITPFLPTCTPDVRRDQHLQVSIDIHSLDSVFLAPRKGCLSHWQDSSRARRRDAHHQGSTDSGAPRGKEAGTGDRPRADLALHGVRGSHTRAACAVEDTFTPTQRSRKRQPPPRIAHCAQKELLSPHLPSSEAATGT